MATHKAKKVRHVSKKYIDFFGGYRSRWGWYIKYLKKMVKSNLFNREIGFSNIIVGISCIRIVLKLYYYKKVLLQHSIYLHGKSEKSVPLTPRKSGCFNRLVPGENRL